MSKYIYVNNKKLLAKDYFAKIALGLPRIYDETTGNYLEHYRELQRVYKEKGIEGYKEYVDMIYKVYDKTLYKSLSFSKKLRFLYLKILLFFKKIKISNYGCKSKR